MKTPGFNQQQFEKVKTHPGFIAALDQSGGSTPGALRLYGIKDSAWSNEAEMFALVHRMRTRIITSPSFTGERIIAAILDLTATALHADPTLSNFAGRVSDSGEGRWTIKAAIDEAVPVPVLSSALFERFESRGEAAFADKLLSAMRFQFGGHQEKAAEKA